MTYLEEAIERAVQLFMAEHAVNRDEALRLIVRDWLAGHGYLPQSEDNSAAELDPKEDAEAILGGA